MQKCVKGFVLRARIAIVTAGRNMEPGGSHLKAQGGQGGNQRSNMNRFHLFGLSGFIKDRLSSATKGR
jgi:hypothetical protein